MSEQLSDREARRADRDQRRAHRRASYGSIYGSWIPGLILILLGGIFLAQNYLGYTLQNWWALFILIPAFGAFSGAAESLRAGHGDDAVGPFVAGLGFTALAGVFLFDLDLGRLWPVALIVIGLGLLISRRRGGRLGLADRGLARAVDRPPR